VVDDLHGDSVQLAIELQGIDHACVMEGHARDAIENRLDVLDLRAFHTRVFGGHLLLRRFQHAIEPPEHGKRQNDAAILSGLVRPAKQVRDGPNKRYFFAEVVHSFPYVATST
jgi:hypothetical protein